MNPRVFLVCSHQPEDPYRIVCNLQMTNLYEGEKPKRLDPRAMFIVQSENELFIWKGASLGQNEATYMKAALAKIDLLRRYEHATNAAPKVVE